MWLQICPLNPKYFNRQHASDYLLPSGLRTNRQYPLFLVGHMGSESQVQRSNLLPLWLSFPTIVDLWSQIDAVTTVPGPAADLQDIAVRDIAVQDIVVRDMVMDTVV